MARSFRQNTDFRTPFLLLKPTWSNNDTTGVDEKTYVDINAITEEYKHSNVKWCEFKSYGGKELIVNDTLTVVDTAQLRCWFHPDIQSDCAILLLDSDKLYEVINEPEDVNLEHVTLQFRVKRLHTNG